MNLVGVIYEMVIKEYNETLINNLISKYKSLNPGLDDGTIRKYIERFSQIKDSPKVQEKDITKYTWQSLENVVTLVKTKPKRSGADELTPENVDLIYNRNGIRVYKAFTKEACLKYGTGYNFCISSRGDRNMYDFYRIEGDGTPYFVFNDNLSKEKNEDGTFVEPNHLVVVFKYGVRRETNALYTVTDANNKGDKSFYTFKDLGEKYTWLRDLKDLFIDWAPNEYEKRMHGIVSDYDTRIKSIVNDIISDFSGPIWYGVESWEDEIQPLIDGTKKCFDYVCNLSLKSVFPTGSKIEPIIGTLFPNEYNDKDVKVWESVLEHVFLMYNGNSNNVINFKTTFFLTSKELQSISKTSDVYAIRRKLTMDYFKDEGDNDKIFRGLLKDVLPQDKIERGMKIIYELVSLRAVSVNDSTDEMIKMYLPFKKQLQTIDNLRRKRDMEVNRLNLEFNR